MKESNKNFWEDILEGEKILSDDEAEEMEDLIRQIRKKDKII